MNLGQPCSEATLLRLTKSILSIIRVQQGFLSTVNDKDPLFRKWFPHFNALFRRSLGLQISPEFPARSSETDKVGDIQVASHTSNELFWYG